MNEVHKDEISKQMAEAQDPNGQPAIDALAAEEQAQPVDVRYVQTEEEIGGTPVTQ